MKLNEKQTLVASLRAKHGSIISRKDLLAFTESNGYDWPNWLLNTKALRGPNRGTYNLIAAEAAVTGQVAAPAKAAVVDELEGTEEKISI